MPRHSKHDQAKRPWYDVPVGGKPQKTFAQRLFKFALFHDWELRPQHLGIWVIARKRYRLFVTFTPDGDKFQDCVLVVNGMEDQERKLTAKQMVRFIKRYGRMWEP